MSEVTKILSQIENGDSQAADQLLPIVYAELRQLASRKLTRESPGQTLQPTALVHEAFLRLVGNNNTYEWQNQGHFFAAAAEAMRRILIENARRKNRSKHGGNFTRCEFHEEDAKVEIIDEGRLLDLDAALSKLSTTKPDLARLVELRFFAGLTIEEASVAMEISPRTVKRNWVYARAWLRREMDRNEA